MSNKADWRGWRWRSRAASWLAVSWGLCGVGAAVLLAAKSGWWQVALVVLVGALGLLGVIDAVWAPANNDGARWDDHRLSWAAANLGARAEIRQRRAGSYTSGGLCQPRYGRDVIIVDEDLLREEEALAVAAHELGHSVQSPLHGPVSSWARRTLVVAAWTAAAGTIFGVAAGLVAVGSLRWWPVRWRWIVVVGAWAWLAFYGLWSWWAGAAVVTLGCWMCGQAAFSRRLESLADEATEIFDGGRVALGRALLALGARDPRWWQRPFASHPAPSGRVRPRRASFKHR